MIGTLLTVVIWGVLVAGVGLVLFRSLSRSGPEATVAPIAVIGAVLFLGFKMIPPSENPEQMNLYAFGEVPIEEGGRVKPFDTYARVTLFTLSDRTTAVTSTGSDAKSRTATQWALDVMTHKEGWEKYPIFYINDDQLLRLLKLEPRSGLRYSYEEILPERPNLAAQFQQARRKEDGKRDALDNKVLDFAQKLITFESLKGWQEPRLVPPEKAGQEWEPLLALLSEDAKPDPSRPAAATLYTLLFAYHSDDAKEFNRSVNDLKGRATAAVSAADASRAGFETFFNQFEPFYVCAVLYVFVFVLACISLAGWHDACSRGALALCLLTFAVHTWALAARMYLLDRPLVFVTNLYSSAIFIGWIAVLLTLALERVFPKVRGLFVGVGAVAGALTMMIAHNIAVGDTLGVLVAVLDTNIWLATHVTTVTIGYSTTFVAGLLGMIYIIMGVFTNKLDRDVQKILSQAIYGIVCFAMLFSFVGTVLGGIWADQSWGRFWGWDPKENGALLIVIWNALILHARWGGMVKQRGVAVLTLFGNIVTSWSWFGTNMLGVGLHSYGFMAGAVIGLLGWIGLNLILIGIGSLPLRMWASFAEAPKPPEEGKLTPPAPVKKGRRGKKDSTAVQPA
jgi:ABC-type transport system involved in cytochrome c biogenesis permease subunit